MKYAYILISEKKTGASAVEFRANSDAEAVVIAEHMVGASNMRLWRLASPFRIEPPEGTPERHGILLNDPTRYGKPVT